MLDALLSRLWTSLLFHVQFELLLLDLHTDFSRGRSGGLVFPSLEEFSIVFVIHTVKSFGIVNKAEVDGFLEFACFFYDPTDVGNLISGSSAFSKSSLNIWSSRFTYCWSLTWRIFNNTLLACEKKSNCVVVWTFFGIAFLWDWNENWPSLVLWPLLHFPNLLSYWVQHF